MLTKINIQNFKSVRSLAFDAKRVNVFIGEPNTGKTNILEALALLSEGVHGPAEFKEVFRFRSVADLFTDQQVASSINVVTPQCQCSLNFKAHQFEFTTKRPIQGSMQTQNYLLDQTGNTSSWVNLQYGIKFYRYKGRIATRSQGLGALQPPFGVNLTSVLYTDKTFRRHVSDMFRSRNFKLEIRPIEMEQRISKEIEDEISISLPYESISETWQRMVFLMAVLETNRDCTLLLDEPEAHTFPFYTKYFAERMALDETNQFFITTHNPYLLSSIVEKTLMKDLAVFVARMEHYDTKLDMVPEKRLPDLLELGPDAFFNLEKLVAE
jgi:AAA15 family ATPase/GTPase